MTQEQTGLVPYESKLLSQAAAVGVDLTPLLARVPEADDDAYVGIIRQLMSAETAADLDAPFTARSLEDYVDIPIRVLGIHKMPSDFDEGLGTYLVIDCEVHGTAGRHTLTTGSVNVVVQLVKAYTLDALPLVCVPRRAKKPTAKGYSPMHLEMVK
jgi:hypothetical protein